MEKNRGRVEPMEKIVEVKLDKTNIDENEKNGKHMCV